MRTVVITTATQRAPHVTRSAAVFGNWQRGKSGRAGSRVVQARHVLYAGALANARCPECTPQAAARPGSERGSGIATPGAGGHGSNR